MIETREELKPLEAKNEILRMIIRKQKDLKNPKKKQAEALTDEEKQVLKAEKKRWKEADKVVKENAQTFIEVGLAIALIRDRELHKLEGMSFEKYLIDRLGVSRSQGYRLIDGAAFAKQLEDKVDGKVLHENHIRQLLPLKDVDKAAEAYNAALKVVAGDSKTKLTAGLIKEEGKKLDSKAYEAKAPKSKTATNDSKKDELKRKLEEAIKRKDVQASLSILAKL